MKIPIYQIDAFANEVFRGNPAAVCPLDHWLEDAQLQAIAAENNLAETAYFVAQGEDYRLRWFTPSKKWICWPRHAGVCLCHLSLPEARNQDCLV